MTTEKGKTYKTLHRKLEVEQHDMNTTKNCYALN
jgi:hypothetical protein